MGYVDGEYILFASEEEYIELLEMPEVFILYRFFFKWLDEKGLKGTDHWRNTWQACKEQVSSEEVCLVLDIIHANSFKDIDDNKSLSSISIELLSFYRISRNDISEKNGLLYNLKKEYDLAPLKKIKRKK